MVKQGSFFPHRETFKKRSQFLTAQYKGQSTAVSGIVLQTIPRDIMARGIVDRASHKSSFPRQGHGNTVSPNPAKQPLREYRGGFVDSDGDASPNIRPSIRIGFTATKKIGNAVVRNRAKRRLRALADSILIPNCRPDYDYVLIARESTVNRSWQKLQNDVIKALKILNVYKPANGSTNND